MLHQITILPAHKIDTEKWDDCVSNAKHQNIFMYSWALNALCDNWDGLIINDYEAILPLPWRKKWFLKYMYHVPFMGKLSIMAKPNVLVDIAIIRQHLLQHFWFINMDTDNIDIPNWIVQKRCNYHILLNNNYQTIQSGYTKACLKNLKKAIARGCEINANGTLDTTITLYDNAYGKLQHQHTKRMYKHATTFATIAVNKGMARIWEVREKSSNNLLSNAIILQDKKRLYYWLAAPTTLGRENRATYFLIDHLLNTYSNSEQIFDFEGSDLPNVAHFYQQFGSQATYYYQLKKSILLPVF